MVADQIIMTVLLLFCSSALCVVFLKLLACLNRRATNPCTPGMKIGTFHRSHFSVLRTLSLCVQNDCGLPGHQHSAGHLYELVGCAVLPCDLTASAQAQDCQAHQPRGTTLVVVVADSSAHCSLAPSVMIALAPADGLLPSSGHCRPRLAQ
jgi:hypothetical protein